MSLAVGRAPRKTAGNRMSKLLDAEEDDEFYKTTYGGFNDESGDDEYKGDQSETEDEVDSDFDIDEGDEPDSDQEEDEPRRKRRVVTKAYKEPIKVVKPKPKPKRPSAPPSGSVKEKEEKQEPLELQDDIGESKTPASSSSVLFRVFLHSPDNVPVIECCQNYERLEADKKKQVHKRRRCDGPTIRYHSVLMPLLSDTHLKEENVDVEGLDQDTQQPAAPPPLAPTLSEPPQQAAQPPGGKCARAFITFSDDDTFQGVFPRPRPLRPPAREICPVTHKPALYRDPITDIPYANIRAFKIIREAYKKYVAAHGLPNTSGSLPGDPGARGPRQKIIIKQSMSAT
nr:PREDICTED: vacuolar protein sorting-associated protein 72 homolog [Lepisosteus oculatus]